MGNKEIIKEAIKEAHRAKPGIILPAEDIYNAILKAGYQQSLKDHEWDDNYYVGKKAGQKDVVGVAEPYLRSLTEMIAVMKNLNFLPTETTMKNIEEIWKIWRAKLKEWRLNDS